VLVVYFSTVPIVESIIKQNENPFVCKIDAQMSIDPFFLKVNDYGWLV
jgi:hypothetical protein